MLACFAGTIIFGIVNGNSPTSIMISAFSVGVVALVIGYIIGLILLRSINEHIERHRVENPIPDENESSSTNVDGPDSLGQEVGQAAVG